MTHLKLILTATTICAGVALGVTGVTAQTADTMETSAQNETPYVPAISLADALTTASAAIEGRVEAIFLEETDLGHVYVAEIYGDLNEATLVINADSGEVVAQFTMQVSSPEYFDLLMHDDGDMEDFYDIDFEEGEDLEDLFMMLDDMGYSVQPTSEQ